MLKSMNIPSSTIGVSVAGGEDTGDQERVDQVGEAFDAEILTCY